MSNNDVPTDLRLTNVKDLPSRANKAWNFSAQTTTEAFQKEVYHPDVTPENVLKSADYEKNMSFSSPQSIIRAAIEELTFDENNIPLKLKCGVIYRRNSMKLRDVVKRPNPIALLQEAAQIVLRMESCAQNLQKTFSHSCITPKLLFLDEGTGLLSLIGLNIKERVINKTT